MSATAVSWADASLVAAAWWSFGVSAASLLAAGVVGVLVYRTLKATKEGAAAAAQQARAAELALEHSRDELAMQVAERGRAVRDAHRTRIDDAMPTVTIRVSLAQLSMHASTAVLENALSDYWTYDSREPVRKQMEVLEPLDLRLGHDGETDQFVWFDEVVTVEFESHSEVPAQVTMPDGTFDALRVWDGRELHPMYLAPGERVSLSYTRRRDIAHIGETEHSRKMDFLHMAWRVGDVRGNAVDEYNVFLPMDFYNYRANGGILSIDPRPDHHRSKSRVAYAGDRAYLREAPLESSG
ncbi:MAG: hypothetical protein ACQEWM_06040 [Actinomycetota bacterium]